MAGIAPSFNTLRCDWKETTHSQGIWQATVSIPSGAIERNWVSRYVSITTKGFNTLRCDWKFVLHKANKKFNHVSIPSGAIESLCCLWPLADDVSFNTLRCDWKQLKTYDLHIGIDSFNTLRCDWKRCCMERLPTNYLVSIPSGAIESKPPPFAFLKGSVSFNTLRCDWKSVFILGRCRK